MNIFLCISIDCECDKGPAWRIRKPLAFSGISQGIGDRLQPLFRRFRVKPTYLLSPEVMRDAKALETIAALQNQAELGTHLHGEFAEPGAFEPDVTAAFQCRYDRETEQQKLHYLTDVFRRSFGRTPRSFRAGRFGIGRHTLGLLQDLGYFVDSSVTPHMNWRCAGAPDVSFLQAPTQPYWPEADKPGQPSPHAGALLEVPVTIRPSVLAKLPIVGRYAQSRWLCPTRGGVGRLVRIAREEIEHARFSGRPIVLNCMFHNVDVVAGTSPFAKNEAEADATIKRLAELLAFSQREGIRSLGLSDVLELFIPSSSAEANYPNADHLAAEQ